MATEQVHCLQLARKQLETAVLMLINGRDSFSIITLAGAADGILSQLVTDSGQDNFYEYARNIYHSLNSVMPKRSAFINRINAILKINALRHHAPDDDEYLEIDPLQSAVNTVTKAMDNYIKLSGTEELFVQSFYQWAWDTQNGPQMMTEYQAAIKLEKKKNGQIS